MTCWKFWHKWKCVKVYHYLDTSYGSKHGTPSTNATYVCSKCNKAKDKLFYGCGYLTTEELNGNKED